MHRKRENTEVSRKSPRHGLSASASAAKLPELKSDHPGCPSVPQGCDGHFWGRIGKEGRQQGDPGAWPDPCGWSAERNPGSGAGPVLPRMTVTSPVGRLEFYFKNDNLVQYPVSPTRHTSSFHLATCGRWPLLSPAQTQSFSGVAESSADSLGGA